MDEYFPAPAEDCALRLRTEGFTEGPLVRLTGERAFIPKMAS